MKDHVHNLLKLVDHNRYMVLAGLVAAVLVLSAFGCQAQIKSPISGEPVTRAQLVSEAEVVQLDLQSQLAALAAEHTAAVAAIEAESQMLAVRLEPAFDSLAQRQAAIEQSLAVVDGLIRQYAGPASEPLLAALGIGGLLLTGGAVADNRRKGRVILERSAGGAPSGG